MYVMQLQISKKSVKEIFGKIFENLISQIFPWQNLKTNLLLRKNRNFRRREKKEEKFYIIVKELIFWFWSLIKMTEENKVL